MEIDITQGINEQVAARFIDELTYRCYVYNRQRSPEIPPEDWVLVFPTAYEMEARYIAGRN